MKIHGNNPPEGRNIYDITVKRSDRTNKPEAPSRVCRTDPSKGRMDMVDLSRMAKEARELMCLIEQIPEVRMDRVNALKKAIDSGTYEIDSSKIAEKMLEEL